MAPDMPAPGNAMARHRADKTRHNIPCCRVRLNGCNAQIRSKAQVPCYAEFRNPKADMNSRIQKAILCSSPGDSYMNKIRCVVCAVIFAALPCIAQQPNDVPNAPNPQPTAPLRRPYVPPTQKERLTLCLRHTFGIYSIFEAGMRGGIEQARDKPSQWPQGAEGYADRFGSSMGQIAARGITEYLLADVFREDLRLPPCDRSCTESKLRRALNETFTARKGDDGHRAFSVARLLGPVAGGAIATNTWYPAGSNSAGETAKQIGMNYGFGFLRNYVRELTH